MLGIGSNFIFNTGVLLAGDYLPHNPIGVALVTAGLSTGE